MKKKTTITIVLACSALLAGCASQSTVAGGEGCVLPVTEDAGMGVRVERCAAWSFGPTRRQAAAFERRALGWK